MSDEVQCWHTEPGTPCDWDACRQPERLAAGDAGTDPLEVPTMASNQTTTLVRCPACDERITTTVQVTYQRGRDATMAFDLDPVRAHLQTHVPGFTFEPSATVTVTA
ncbi:hypothetical protein [Streptomyces sp. OR43]|uniref:hypothetical protein n=1 Tax=Streptomyces sp. or43 TaxID=2478957 RepID=UPI0011CD36E7|nr:hypothetical protein [Streptomyces sp. or43]TXS36937.1 hypothetical protein EAO72_26490 [Streptomyces sp. or43]